AAGLSVPSDLSVTGCDGILPGADLLGLTTVRIPVEDVAAAAVETMQTLLTSDAPVETVRRGFCGELVAGTTAAARCLLDRRSLTRKRHDPHRASPSVAHVRAHLRYAPAW